VDHRDPGAGQQADLALADPTSASRSGQETCGTSPGRRQAERGALRQTATGGTRLRLEGIPLLLAGLIFTTSPDGIAAALPGWPPMRVVLLLLGGYVLSRLMWGWWLPSGEVQPMPSRPQVGCVVLWQGPPLPAPPARPPVRVLSKAG
jgi:hypothetical protein